MTPSAFRFARLLHGCPQFGGDGGHAFIAGMAGHTRMLDLTFRTGGILRIGCDLAEVDENSPGVIACLLQELVLLGIRPELAAYKDFRMAVASKLGEQVP